jgi:hypothetical protein
MACLEACPEAECVTGNLFPTAFAHLAAQPLSDELRSILARGLRHSLQQYLQTGMYLSRSAAVRKWWKTGHQLDGLPGAMKGVRRENNLVYKEPFFAFAPEFFAGAVPDARLIYIYRDGRDVANSLFRSYDVLSDERLATLDTNEAPIGREHGAIYIPWWVADGEEDAFVEADQFTRALWMWREMIRAWLPLSAAAASHTDSILPVKYEDLVTNPREQGERILSHLRLKPTRRVLARFEGAHARSIGSHKRDDARPGAGLADAELRALGYATA